MGKGIEWGHLGNFRNYRVAGAQKEEQPLSLEERQQQVFNKFNSWKYEPEKLKPAFGWLGAPEQGAITPTPQPSPSVTPSPTPTMTPTPSSTPSPAFSPSGITGLQLWFDADDTNTLSLSGNYVESWTSKGNTPLVLTATTSVRRPEYITTGGTGTSPALLFFSSSTAANRSLLTQQDTTQSFNLTSGYTIFMAQKNIGAKTAAGYIGSFGMYLYKYGSNTPAVNQQILTALNGNNSDNHQTGATTGYAIQYGSPGIINGYYWSGSSYSIKYHAMDYTDMGPTKVYGQDIYSGSPTITQSTNPFVTSYTGKTINGMGIGGYNFVGTPQGLLSTPNEIYEILVYNRKLTTNEANSVMDYLRGRWDYVVDLSNSAVFNVNYTGKTNNVNDFFLMTSNTSPLNTIGNSYFGGQGMKYILNGGVDAYFNSQFLTSNLGVNYTITDSNGYVVDSATCRKTTTNPITYSAGTYNIVMDMDYNCVDPSPSPTETPTMTPTPTETPTPTITPTFAPTPSSTPQPISMSFSGSSIDTADQSSYTFSSVNTGTGLIVVLVNGSASYNSGRTFTGATIGGVTATIVHNESVNGGPSLGNMSVQALIYAEVTGSTNDIVINFNGTCQAGSISYWRITNYTSSTPFYSDGYSNNGNTTNASRTTSSLSGNNVGIAGAIIGDGGITSTWTNATERYDTQLQAGLPRISGADFTTSSSGTITITDSFSALNTRGVVFSIAVWK